MRQAERALKNLRPAAMNENKSLLEERLRMLAEDYKSLLEAPQSPRKSIRVNTLKTTLGELASSMGEQGFKLKPVRWTDGGFWVEGSGLSDTIEYFLGQYYIQESSSMIPAEMLRPGVDDFVLDAAAAPGGKTVQLAGLMGNDGCIIANEVNGARRAALRFNLSKYGVLNAVVTSMDLSRSINADVRFDKILLDAPCSCEGQFRRNPDTLKQWSMSKVMRCSKLQKKLLSNCLNMLQEGGVLVYSTCTLAPEENEEVVDYALSKFDGLRVKPLGNTAFKYRPGLTEWQGRQYNPKVEGCARILPQDNDGEGFFIARLVKCGR